MCMLEGDECCSLTVQQINLMIDPEGTKIALTAPFPNISKFVMS